MAAMAATLAAACAPLEPQPAAPAVAAAAPAVAPHRSAFEGYRPFGAEAPASGWREANEAVREAGGHIGIMKGHGH